MQINEGLFLNELHCGRTVLVCRHSLVVRTVCCIWLTLFMHILPQYQMDLIAHQVSRSWFFVLSFYTVKVYSKNMKTYI